MRDVAAESDPLSVVAPVIQPAPAASEPPKPPAPNMLAALMAVDAALPPCPA